MEFDPAFALLKKFTLALPSSESGSDTIYDQELAAVVKYLGIPMPEGSFSECVRVIESELINQNKFLTANLEKDDVEQTELYEKSQFIREVVANNRERS